MNNKPKNRNESKIRKKDIYIYIYIYIQGVPKNVYTLKIILKVDVYTFLGQPVYIYIYVCVCVCVVRGAEVKLGIF